VPGLSDSIERGAAPFARGKYLLFGALGIASAIADQLSKAWVQHHLPTMGRSGMSVIGRRLMLIYAENPGIAFSQFQNLSGGRVVLSLVSLGALGLIIGYLRTVPSSSTGTIAGLGLIWGGALGNVIDRVAHGAVTDFVLVNLGVWPFNPWPVFNVADAVLVAGVAMMILGRLKRAPQIAQATQ
jgi:signal peptidase II